MVFEDENIQVFFTSATHDQTNFIWSDEAHRLLLITFAPLNFKANGLGYWGSVLGPKLDCAVLGIVAKAGNWYPMNSMASCLTAISEILLPFKYIVTYGTSMGGFGSIKYGKLFKATHCISFAPQYSISPEEVKSWDRRFLSHYNPSLNNNMEIIEADLAGTSYILYDPMYKEDAVHATYLNKISDSIYLLNARFTHHFPIELFASAPALATLLTRIILGNRNDIESLVTERRRSSKVRIRYVAELATHRSEKLGIEILEKYKSRVSDNDLLNGFSNIGSLLKEKGNFKLSNYCFQRCVELAPKEEKYTILLVSSLNRLKEYDKSLEIASSYLEKNASAQVYNSLCGIFLEVGKLAEAEKAINEAISLQMHVDYMLRKSRIIGRMGKKGKEIEMLYEIVFKFPENKAAFSQLKNCLANSNRNNELNFLRTYWQYDVLPSNE